MPHASWHQSDGCATARAESPRYGSLVLWSFIGVAFFRWYEREQAQDREPRWDEVEEELRELGLTTKR